MSQERVRLFVALELPGEVRQALGRWQGRLPTSRGDQLRLVAPGTLHVTLCFLGSQLEADIGAIAAACEVAAADPAPRLEVSGALWLPPRRPRVLAIKLEDLEGRLAHTQGALSDALSAGGWYEPEKRPYMAHVTVARVKTSGSARRELPEPPRLEFQAPRVVLYRSRLSRSGARYEALASVELADSA